MIGIIHQSLASLRGVSSALGPSQSEFSPSSDTLVCSLAQASILQKTRLLGSGGFSFSLLFSFYSFSSSSFFPPPHPTHSFSSSSSSSSFSFSWESGCIMARVVWCPCSLLSPVLSVTELFPQRPTQTARVDYSIQYTTLYYRTV